MNGLGRLWSPSYLKELYLGQLSTLNLNPLRPRWVSRPSSSATIAASSFVLSLPPTLSLPLPNTIVTPHLCYVPITPRSPSTLVVDLITRSDPSPGSPGTRLRTMAETEAERRVKMETSEARSRDQSSARSAALRLEWSPRLWALTGLEWWRKWPARAFGVTRCARLSRFLMGSTILVAFHGNNS